MKKPISIFLAASIAIPTILTAVSGCVNASAADIMTNGELLELINNKFGFDGYESSESYYASVPSSDAFFDAVQTAHEYEVLDEQVTDFKTSDVVTREFFAMAASGAIYSDYTDEISISDISDITYKDDVLTVLNYGIMELDNGKFEPKKTMSGAECVLLIDVAHDVWSNYSVVKPKYDVQLKDDVVDLAGIGYYTYSEETNEIKRDDESYELLVRKLSDNHYSYDADSNVIVLDSIDEFGIEKGTVMPIATGDDFNPYKIVKVTDIVQQDDGTYKIFTEQADVDECFSQYSVEQSAPLDMSKVEYIYDNEGNKIYRSYDNVTANTNLSLGGASDSVSGYMSRNLTNENVVSNTSLLDTFEDAKNGKFTVNVNGLIIGISASYKNDLSFTIGCKTPSPTPGKKDSDNTSGIKGPSVGDVAAGTVTITHTFSNMDADYKYDFWGGYAKFVIKYNYSKKITANGTVGKSVSICKIPLEIVPGVDVVLEPKLNFTISGEVYITLNKSNIAEGLEYRRGRGINHVHNDGTPSVDASCKVKITASFSFDVYLSAVWGAFKAGVEPEIGVVLEVAAETHVIPAGDKIVDLTCFDLKIYPILNLKLHASVFKISGEIVLEFANGSTKDEGEGNVWLHKHFEDCSETDPHFQLVKECTKDKWLNLGKDIETEKAGVTIGDALCLSCDEMTINIDESFKVNITTVPSGYNCEDIYVKTSNSDIIALTDLHSIGVTYNATPLALAKYAVTGNDELLANKVMDGARLDDYDCEIKGLAKGESTVKFITKDGKFTAECKVTVNDPNEPLDLDVKLNTYGITIGQYSEQKITIERLPWYLTEEDIVWNTSDASVVTVTQNGVVAGVGEGYATIVATTPDGTSKAYCNVTVTNVGQLTLMFVPDRIIEYQI